MLTLPRQSAGAGKSPAETVGDLAADILAKFPLPFDMEMIVEKYPVLYEESMNTVLRQELIRFNRLIVVVRESLFNIQKAIKVILICFTTMNFLLFFNSKIILYIIMFMNIQTFLTLLFYNVSSKSRYFMRVVCLFFVRI